MNRRLEHRTWRGGNHEKYAATMAFVRKSSDRTPSLCVSSANRAVGAMGLKLAPIPFYTFVSMLYTL